MSSLGGMDFSRQWTSPDVDLVERLANAVHDKVPVSTLDTAGAISDKIVACAMAMSGRHELSYGRQTDNPLRANVKFVGKGFEVGLIYTTDVMGNQSPTCYLYEVDWGHQRARYLAATSPEGSNMIPKSPPG